jgi:hypothetical protein
MKINGLRSTFPVQLSGRSHSGPGTPIEPEGCLAEMNRGGVGGPLGTHRTHAMMGPISHSHPRRSELLKWLPRDPSRAHREERGRRLEVHRAHHASLRAILVNISHAHRPRLPFRCQSFLSFDSFDVPFQSSKKLAK